MTYGAPTHRIESQLYTTADYLDVSASFLYLPNILIVTISDYETHTCRLIFSCSEKIKGNYNWAFCIGENFYIRSSGGLDLARLSKTHQVYTEVVTGKLSPTEGSVKLREIVRSVSDNKTNDKFTFKHVLYIARSIQCISNDDYRRYCECCCCSYGL